MKALDVEAVQAFVLVADLKSFTRAAEAMETTQSMVSLKIKRLEDGLGRRLLERTPRLVRLSADGAGFLDAARGLVAAHQQAIGAFAVEPRRLVVGLQPPCHRRGAPGPAETPAQRREPDADSTYGSRSHITHALIPLPNDSLSNRLTRARR